MRAGVRYACWTCAVAASFCATPGFAAVITVTSTADSGTGTLRDAITQENADGTTPRVINFNIPGSGVQTITPVTALPPVTKFMTIDGTTQPGYAGTPLIVINGNSGDFDGLTINAFFTGNSSNKTFVKGLCIVNFGTNSGTPRHGLVLKDGDSDNVLGCYLGINAAGTAAAPNTGAGIHTEFAVAVIGGTTASARNIISGNLGPGIDVNQDPSGGFDSVTITGNWIGLSADGQNAVPNGGDGIAIASSSSSGPTVNVGSLVAGGGNVISGNTRNGVHSSRFSNILGNIIGLKPDGTTAMGNVLNGVLIDTRSARVGDGSSAGRNIISANGGTGVLFSGPSAPNDFAFGNYVGTDATGLLPRGNAGGGVYVSTGAWAVRTNVVSGNTGDGIRVVSGNGIINGNIVGGSANSAAFAIPNTSHGIEVVNTQSGDIRNNTVVGNNGDGIHITGAAAQNIVIAGNTIGTNLSGANLGNVGSGLSISGGAQHEVIGSATINNFFDINTMAFNKGGGTASGGGEVTSGNDDNRFGVFKSNFPTNINSPNGFRPIPSNVTVSVVSGDDHATGTLTVTGAPVSAPITVFAAFAPFATADGSGGGDTPKFSASGTTSNAGAFSTIFDLLIAPSEVGQQISAFAVANPGTASVTKTKFGPPAVVNFPPTTGVLRSVANVSVLNPVHPEEPVNTNTGELYGAQPPDLSLGGPMPLRFQRYYASLIQSDGRITGRTGQNWLHNFEMKLTQTGSAIEVVTNAGRSINFNNIGGNWVLTGRLDIPYQLVASGPNFILGDPLSQRLYTFDSTGKLIQIADGRGNAHTLNYTGADLTSVTDGLGRSLTFTYSTGRLSTVSDGTRSISFGYTGNDLTSFTDALTFVTNYSYDTSNAVPGLMIAKTEPEGNQPEVQNFAVTGQVTSQTERGTDSTRLGYSGSQQTTSVDPQNQTMVHAAQSTGELSGITDEAGKTLTVGSDSTGRRNAVTDRLGSSTSIVYHPPSGKPATITNADGKITSCTYQSRSVSGITFYDLSTVSYPDGTSESFGYDGSGNMTSHTDRANKLWSYTYNAHGQMLTATNPTGGVVTLTYDPNGNLASSKDSDTGITTYQHDALDRLTRITHPDTTFIQVAYDADNRITSITDERTNSYGYTYDHNGRVTVITDPATHTTQFGYDALDRVLSATDRLNHAASRTFNSRDDVATVTDRNNNTRTFGYDTRRRRTSIIDPAGKTWSFGYDDEAVLSSFTNPVTQTTSAPTDKLGLLKAVTDPLSHTMSINRDSMKRVTSTVDPIGRVNSYAYDARGLLTSAGRTGLPTASYHRNNLGLVDQITDLNGQNWSYGFSGVGRMTSATDPLTRSSSSTYDSRGRLMQTTFAGGATLLPTFDAANNLTRLLYSTGPDLQFSYDSLNRLTNANAVVLSYDFEGRITNTATSGVNFGAGYDNGGRLTTATYNNGAFTVTYGYDTRDRLISVSDNLTATSVGFGYDDAGRLTSMTRSNGVNGVYTYDAAGRLTRIQEGSIIDLQYTLDPAGQISAATMTVPLDPAQFIGNAVTNFSYDAASQINSSGYNYDARGRLTASPGHTFAYDGASRLTTSDTASLTFNGLSDVLTRAQGGTTTHYFYNKAIGLTPIVAEKNDTTNQFVRYYVWTPGGRLLYSIDANTSAVSFYHADYVGSTLALTNSAGTATDSYAYGPYGETLGHNGSSTQPFTYVGSFGVRADGSLYHMRARFYDPATARFLTRDPRGPSLRNPQSLGRYVYAANNPLNRVDPVGGDWTTTYPEPPAVDPVVEAEANRLNNELDKTMSAEERAYVDQQMARELWDPNQPLSGIYSMRKAASDRFRSGGGGLAIPAVAPITVRPKPAALVSDTATATGFQVSPPPLDPNSYIPTKSGFSYELVSNLEAAVYGGVAIPNPAGISDNDAVFSDDELNYRTEPVMLGVGLGWWNLNQQSAGDNVDFLVNAGILAAQNLFGSGSSTPFVQGPLPLNPAAGENFGDELRIFAGVRLDF